MMIVVTKSNICLSPSPRDSGDLPAQGQGTAVRGQYPACCGGQVWAAPHVPVVQGWKTHTRSVTLTCQWFKDGKPIPGQSPHVPVVKGWKTHTRSVTLTYQWFKDGKPIPGQSPPHVPVVKGWKTHTRSVTLTYQWFKDGKPIPGQSPSCTSGSRMENPYQVNHPHIPVVQGWKTHTRSVTPSCTSG